MDKSSSKRKLSKKLKIISIASTVIMCSTISANVYKASAGPVSKFFRGLGIHNPFRIRSRSTGNLNDPNRRSTLPRSSSDTSLNSSNTSGFRGRLMKLKDRITGGNNNNGVRSGQVSSNSSSSESLDEILARPPLTPTAPPLPDSENLDDILTAPPLRPTAPPLPGSESIDDILATPPLTPTAPPLSEIDSPRNGGNTTGGASSQVSENYVGVYTWWSLHDGGSQTTPPPLPPRKYKK